MLTTQHEAIHSRPPEVLSRGACIKLHLRTLFNVRHPVRSFLFHLAGIARELTRGRGTRAR